MSDKLATHIDRTIEVLTAQVDTEEESSGGIKDKMGMGIGREQALNMLRPMLQKWVKENPQKARKAVGVLHLATQDLVTEHNIDLDKAAEEIEID